MLLTASALVRHFCTGVFQFSRLTINDNELEQTSFTFMSVSISFNKDASFDSLDSNSFI